MYTFDLKITNESVNDEELLHISFSIMSSNYKSEYKLTEVCKYFNPKEEYNYDYIRDCILYCVNSNNTKLIEELNEYLDSNLPINID